MKKVRIFLRLGLVLAFLLPCTIAFSQLTPEIPRNETFIADVLGGRVVAPNNFNVFVTTWRTPDRGVQQVMLEPLWMIEPTTGEVINALASEAPAYNEDFTQMTVKLREGCCWSDGVPITADDIVYGIETTMKYPEMAYNSEFNLWVKNISKTDTYTIVFELNEPNSRFHTYFVDRWGAWRPFPKHIFEKVENPTVFDFNPPISSGPYVLKGYDPGGYWTLWERREDWDKTPTGILYGMPKPKYVLFYYYGEAANKVIAQANHNLDMTDLTMEAFRALLDKNKYSRGYRKEYPWVVNVDPCMTGITLNNAQFPFNLKDVRWALTLSIDIVDYMGNAFDGASVMGVLHIPPTPVYQEWYYKPMEGWLENFALDIEVNGEPFKPYDSSAPLKLIEYAKSRGYKVPEDPERAREIFGFGWWKYAPDVAEQLLLRNSFKRDANGKWLLPDGTPWKITIIAHPSSAQPQNRNAFAAAQEWRQFGIEVEVRPDEMQNTITNYGEFEASGVWPANAPWGGHPDLHRVLRVWHSKYWKPIGEPCVAADGGAQSRWKNEKLDTIIDEMEKLSWDDPKNIELGIEGLKIAVEEMPTIETFIYPGVVAWDEYYWTNYPGAENPYCQPYHHWPNFKYMLPFLEPTGRK